VEVFGYNVVIAVKLKQLWILGYNLITDFLAKIIFYYSVNRAVFIVHCPPTMFFAMLIVTICTQPSLPSLPPSMFLVVFHTIPHISSLTPPFYNLMAIFIWLIIWPSVGTLRLRYIPFTHHNQRVHSISFLYNLRPHYGT
jgi:hypothetical protein